MKNEIVSEVCGAMFGEERVNNSVALLSKVSIAFSVGQISALVAAILQVPVYSQEDFIHGCHTCTEARQHGYTALRTTCSFHGTCC